MLEVRGLSVSYGTTNAVIDLDLDASANEAVALLGPNGAGKTSTLRAISQLVPYTGVVRFDGTDLRKKTPYDVARSGLVHVPEGRHVFPALSVHENLQMGQTASGRRRPTYSIDDVYDLFPALQPLRRRDGFALSGGEQQMVAIGRALVSAPRLLILDEPSLGLAPVVTKVVFEALRQIAADTTILLVEQNTSMALRLCARAYVMSGGEIRLSGTAAELGDREQILASYLGQRDVVRTHHSLAPDDPADPAPA
jgi:branched-chain amino acid transport system ATP-binding protein